MNITDRIICWQMTEPEVGEAVRDSYNYQGVVKEKIAYGGRVLGVVLHDIRHLHELKELSREVPVVCLRELLQATFDVKLRPGARQLKSAPKGKGKR